MLPKILNKCFIILFFISCNNSENIEIDLLDGNDYIYYNDVSTTKFPRSLGNTYCFKKNGELYIFSYDLKLKTGRICDLENFNNPKKWSIEKDSIIIDNKKFKITQKNQEEFLLIDKVETIILKREKDTFNINFFKKNNKFHITNKKGDTLKSIEIIEM